MSQTYRGKRTKYHKNRCSGIPVPKAHGVKTILLHELAGSGLWLVLNLSEVSDNKDSGKRLTSARIRRGSLFVITELRHISTFPDQTWEERDTHRSVEAALKGRPWRLLGPGPHFPTLSLKPPLPLLLPLPPHLSRRLFPWVRLVRHGAREEQGRKNWAAVLLRG
eukprot:1290710-Rhodomonas_salina.1